MGVPGAPAPGELAGLGFGDNAGQAVVRFGPMWTGVMSSTVSFSGGGWAVVEVVGTGFAEPAPEGCTGVAGLASGGKNGGAGGAPVPILLLCAVLCACASRPVRGL